MFKVATSNILNANVKMKSKKVVYFKLNEFNKMVKLEVYYPEKTEALLRNK